MPITVRRSMLEVPGNIQRMVDKSRGFGVDVLMLDLEDSVPATTEAKVTARGILSEAIPRGGFQAREVALRLNCPSSEWFVDDANLAAELSVRLVVLPKAYSAEEVAFAAEYLDHRYKGDPPKMILIVETPGALLDLGKIAEAGHNLTGLVSGGFDYTLETGSTALLTAGDRMDDSHLLYNRLRVLAFARRMGWTALDGLLVKSPKDADDVRRSAERSRAVGFDGCALYYPPHVETVNDVFSPSKEELEWADGVISAYAASADQGRAAVAVDGHVVLPQHYKMATRLKAYSEALEA